MNKQILPLFLVAVVVVGAAAWLLLDKNVEQGGKQNLFGDLRAHADQIDTIVLKNHQGVLLNAKQENGRWVVLSDSFSTYPADQSQLADLLIALTDAMLLEAKTAKAENYARLGVDSVNTPDSQSTLVELSAGSKRWAVLIGNTPSSGVGQYVRKPSESQSWQVDTAIEIAEEMADWLQQPVLDLDSESVVAVSRNGEFGWRAVKGDSVDAAYVLENMPEGRTLRYDGILDSAVESILNVRFDALADSDEQRWRNPERIVSELTLNTSNGDEISAVVANIDDQHFLRFSLRGDGSKPYWHELDYRISSFSASQLTKTREDFLNPQASEEGPLPTSIDEGEAPQE